MAANHSGLQTSTMRNLLLAWGLTLPVSVMLGAILFVAGLYIVIHGLVIYALAAAGVLLIGLALLVLRRVAAAKTRAEVVA